MIRNLFSKIEFSFRQRIKEVQKVQLLVLWMAAFSGASVSVAATTGSGSDVRIGIRMQENLSPSERRLTFVCGTSDFYPCSNFAIEFTHTMDDDRITIRFNGIFRPAVCTRAPGPATATIDPGALPNRVYELEIFVGTTRSSGQLIVSDSSFRVNMQENGLVYFTNPILMRVPEQTIYGAINYHAPSTASLAAAFIDSLISLGATTTRFPEGKYGGFEIDANGEIKQIHNVAYRQTLRFIFVFPYNMASVKDLVRHFGMEYRELLDIRVYTSEGDSFFSWVR